MSILTVGNGSFHNHVLALLLRSLHHHLLAGECTLFLILVLGNTTCSTQVHVIVGNAAETVEVRTCVRLNELSIAISPVGEGSILCECDAEVVAGDGVILHLQLALLLDSWQFAMVFLHEGRVGYRCACYILCRKLELLLSHLITLLAPGS